MQKLDVDEGNAAVDIFRRYLVAEGANAYLLRDDDVVIVAASGELGHILEDAFHRDADAYAARTKQWLERRTDTVGARWWVHAGRALLVIVIVLVIVFASFVEFFLDVGSLAEPHRSTSKELLGDAGVVRNNNAPTLIGTTDYELGGE